jgi:uncharacterized membrane protein HdeD (DUF308 family)
MFWIAASVLAMVYCFVRGAWDLRQKRYLWGVLGIVSGIAVGTMPIQSHAIKIDLPASN